MKQILSWVMVLVATPAAAMSRNDFNVQVEPIVGYERAYKVVPDPHTSARLMYGVRATAGYSILSAELEGTRASDSEAYPATARLVEETSDKIKLGLRSSIDRSLGSAFFRAGGQAQRLTRVDTVSSVSTRSQDPLSINPYAGVGAELGSQGLRLTGAATVVFRNLSNWQQNEVETTLGIRIGR